MDIVFEDELTEQFKAIERHGFWDRVPDVAVENEVPLLVILGALNQGVQIQLRAHHITELQYVKHGGRWDGKRTKVEVWEGVW